MFTHSHALLFVDQGTPPQSPQGSAASASAVAAAGTLGIAALTLVGSACVATAVAATGQAVNPAINITSAQAGDFHSTSTWVGGVVPSKPNRAIIDAGHTVTNTGTADVGDSPADDTGTPCLSGVSSTSIFINRGTFIPRGPVHQPTGAQWDMGNGDCVVEYNSALAPNPATALWRWRVGMADNTATKLVGVGSAGHRNILRIGSGSGKAGGFWFGGTNGARSCQLQLDYLNAFDWGDGSHPFARVHLTTAGDQFSLDHVTGLRCGPIERYEIKNGTMFRLKNFTWKSPAVDAFGRSMYGNGSGNDFNINPSSGDRRFENFCIEGTVSLSVTSGIGSQSGIHFVNGIFAGGTADGHVPLVCASNFAAAESLNVLVLNRVAANGNPSSPYSGLLERFAFLRTSGVGGNLHFLDAIKADTTFRVGFFEAAENLSRTGDCWQTAPRNGAGYTVDFENVVEIPTPNGQTIGALVNSSGAGTYNGTTVIFGTHRVRHCTFLGDEGSGDVIGCGGEANTGMPGLFDYVKWNLVWRQTLGVGFICRWNDATTPQAGTYTFADENAYWNLTGTRYHRSASNPTIYTATPGLADFNADPQFADSTRKFLTWAQSVDPTVTSWADALDRFSRMNDDTGAVAGFTVSAYIDWVMDGWRPTNPAYVTTVAGDGLTFGAMGAPVVLGGLAASATAVVPAGSLLVAPLAIPGLSASAAAVAALGGMVAGPIVLPGAAAAGSAIAAAGAMGVGAKALLGSPAFATAVSPFGVLIVTGGAGLPTLRLRALLLEIGAKYGSAGGRPKIEPATSND